MGFFIKQHWEMGSNPPPSGPSLVTRVKKTLWVAKYQIHEVEHLQNSPPHPQRHPVSTTCMAPQMYKLVAFNFIRLFFLIILNVKPNGWQHGLLFYVIYLFIYLFLCQFNLCYCISQRKMVQNFPLKQIKNSDHLSEDYLSLNSGKI